MPDISMCPSRDCPVRGYCRRNEASGTRPDYGWQSWIAWTWQQPGGLGAPVECDGLWLTSAGRAALQKEEEGR